MTPHRSSFLVAGLFLALATTAQPKSPFTYHDMLMLDRISGLAVDPDCEGDEIGCTVQRMQAAAGARSGGTVYDRVFMRHWDTWADGTRNHLFHIPLDQPGAAPVALTDALDGDVPGKPFGGNEDFTISADGRTVFFVVREARNIEPWSTNFDLYSVPVTGGEDDP